MRKEAACLVVLACLVLGAGSAQAAPSIVADWPLDEGVGTSVRDVSGHGLTGTFASGSAAPSWTAGHNGGFALRFDGDDYVKMADVPSLEPLHVAVEAWVRALGSPGNWRYVLSKGSVACDRSAYGLYSGWAGGMSFYVSSATHYMISPEVPARLVWDGRWHHVIGTYDGARVRLSVDGAQVGDGNPGPSLIAYGVGSKGIRVGAYNGSCNLGFFGDIADVRIWNDPPPPPANPPPPITPVPGTPSQVAVSGGGGGATTTPSQGSTSSSGGSTTKKKAACLRVSLNPRTIRVKRRVRVKATVRRASKKPVAGVRLLIRGAGVKKNARTNRKGTATIVVKARKRGRLTARIRGQKSSCPAATVRAR